VTSAEPPPGHVVVLVTSPQVPAGLLTAGAWDTLRAAGTVWSSTLTDQVSAVRAAGVPVRVGPVDADRLLDAVASGGNAVLLAGPADHELVRAVGLRLVRAPGPATLELCHGSWDPPTGAGVRQAVEVVEQLLGSGGDPWLTQFGEAERGSAGLAEYLIEEAYEAVDALLSGDRAALREELGDVLFQVILHAGLAARWGPADRAGAAPGTAEGFDLDDVAADLAAKLIRRNPHVFAGTAVSGLTEISANWDEIKKSEKPRSSALDGIPTGLPALALAAKVLSRADRAGLPVICPAGGSAIEALGERLFSMVAQARVDGLDAELALRQTVIMVMNRLRDAEQGGSPLL